MPRRLGALALLASVLVLVTASRAAEAQIVTVIVGDRAPVAVDAALRARLTQREVTADDHGTTSRFEGVRLADLLRELGVPVDSVRGRRATLVVVALARDGYRALFSLAELALDLGGRDVMIAGRRDGAPLDSAQGPLRLVVPGDRRASRWVRQLETIRVLDALPGPERAP